MFLFQFLLTNTFLPSCATPWVLTPRHRAPSHLHLGPPGARSARQPGPWWCGRDPAMSGLQVFQEEPRRHPQVLRGGEHRLCRL